MNNHVQPGDTLTVTLPRNVTSGEGVKVGTALFGVASDRGFSGDEAELAMTGVYDLAKEASLALTTGALAYWDNTAFKITSTSSGNKFVGVIVKAAAGADAHARVRLTGQV